MTANTHLRDRYTGALLGLAVGDALGAAVEFKPPGTFRPLTTIVGGGPHNLRPGAWTDDTSMALCLAESLIECEGLDPTDQLRRYVRWWQEGYMSSTGACFDIGNTTRAALAEFVRTGNPAAATTDPSLAGNGSIMRLAPVPLFFAKNPERAVARSGESSITTHAARTAVDGCRYLGGLIVGALRGESKRRLLSEAYSPVPGLWESQPLTDEIDRVARGSFKRKSPPEIQGSGYVVSSLEAALWAFSSSKTFSEGCLLAANLGDDADTTAAVYGQLAGAYYGAKAIPAEWLEVLFERDLIERYARKLYELAQKQAPTST